MLIEIVEDLLNEKMTDREKSRFDGMVKAGIDKSVAKKYATTGGQEYSDYKKLSDADKARVDGMVKSGIEKSAALRILTY